MNQIPQEALDQMKREGWATAEEQRAYWEKNDLGGNVLPDRIEANEDRYELAPDEERDAYINDIYTSFPGEEQ